jgi:peptidoglycan hydrolase CwlO-like protein
MGDNRNRDSAPLLVHQPKTGIISHNNIWRLLLLALATGATTAVVMYLSVPGQERQLRVPNENSMRELQASQQQLVNQLTALQQTVSSGQAEMKHLSDQISVLTAKLQAMQETLASAQQAVPQQAEPAKRRRAAP